MYIRGLFWTGIMILLIWLLCTFMVLILIAGLIGIICTILLLIYDDRQLDIRIKRLHQDIEELDRIFKNRKEEEERLKKHHLEKFLMMVNSWDDTKIKQVDYE